MNRPLLAAALLLAAPAAAQQSAAPHVRQGVDYRIEARLDEATDVLHGRARLRYTNRSGTALDTLYVHQHLNAFRPNSAWARRELEYGVTRFQELGPEEHAFERFGTVAVDGRAVRPVYPGAPDSTVAAIPLPSPLAPGQAVTVTMDWDARLSTVPRRQGRAGRHYDWAQWYPRIAVFDRRGWQQHPLLPQGEFYGEFGSYDVTLDLAADQVVGSTGVAVAGDPGYPVTAEERGVYPATQPEALGLLTGEAGAGRKRVRWRADDVIHFGWSADPTYRHDGVARFSLGDSGDRSELADIHVLYLPADTGWQGTVARRTLAALQWTQGKIGPYPWPQLTVVHRLESGGTEFPMLIMNGSSSEGLIVHETVHQWLHGILANNEWREGWLDEGFTSFMTNWYWEEKGQADVWNGTMEGLARLARADSLEAVSLPGAAYSSPRIYSAVTYTKASAVFRMLREMVGEETFTRILHEYYRRHRLQKVSREDFQRVAEEVSGRDLDWFWAQWIDRTDRLDYGVTDARTERAGRGWRTTVQVLRLGEAWMPVTLQVGGATRTLDSRERVQTVTVVTPERPTEAVLDPRRVLIDMDWSNNRAPVR